MNDEMANSCDQSSEYQTRQSLAKRWFQVFLVCLPVLILSDNVLAFVSQGGDAAWSGFFGQTGSAELESTDHDWCYFNFEPYSENWTYTIIVRDLSGKLLFSKTGRGTPPFYVVPSDVRVSWQWSDQKGLWSGEWDIGAADYIDSSAGAVRRDNVPFGQSGRHVFVVRFNSSTKLRARIKLSSTGWESGYVTKARLRDEGGYYTLYDAHLVVPKQTIPGGTDPQLVYKDDSDNPQNELVAFGLDRFYAPLAGLLNYEIQTFGVQPPIGVSASDGIYTDKVRVTWNSVSDATGYEVWRNTINNPETSSKLGSSVLTRYDDDSATPMRRYYYWVKTNTPDGTSSFSSSDEGYRRLATPTGVEASDGTYTDKVLVTWNGVSEATGYEVWRNTSSDSGSATKIGSTTGRNYEDTAVTPMRRYRYWVKAKNSYGTSSFSISYDIGYRKLATPTGVDASDGEYTDKVRITWNLVPEATGYEVWYHTANDSRTATRIADGIFDTVYDDAFATPGTIRYYWVKAENLYGTSDFSAPDTGYRQQPPLSEISVIPASRDFGSVPVGSYANDYFTVLNTGGGTLTGNAWVASPFRIISGGSYSLTAGQTQRVDVQFSPTSAGAFNGVVTFTGGGGATRPVTGTGNSPQETDPPYPNEIESITPVSPAQINIVSKQADDATPPVWYEIDGQFWDVSSWVDGDGGVSDYDYSTARPNPWSDSELLPNRLYQYRQRVKDSAGPCNQSSWSDWSEKYTLANIPSAPTISNPTTTTLDVYVNPNSNPPNTEFAIQCTSTSPQDLNWSNKWVDDSGNPTDSEVWQTAAVSTGQTTGGSAPSLIQDSDGKYWVAFSYSSDIYISNSLDAITWSSPINITNVGNASSSSLIQDSDGVYRLAFGAGSAEPYKIYVISSSDGLSWFSPVQVTTGSTSFEPCIIQDSNRRYWLAYNSYSGIYVTSSDDFVNWGSPTRIVSGFMAGSSLIQDAAGKYWIAYYYHGGDWGVYITGSPDGTSWDNPMEIVSGQDDGYYDARNPELIQDSAGSYWMTYGTVDKGGKHDVALISSSDGENWSSPTTVAGGDFDDGYTSSIIQDESGIYWVVFPSDRSGGRDLWITGSETFNGIGPYPYLLWQTEGNKTIQGLMPNTTYSFKVKARNGDGAETSLGTAGSGTTGAPIGDFCGANFTDQPDGYVDYWDLLYFARRWHTSPSDTNWDSRCDLAKEDNYVDYWDLLIFAQHWHEGEPP